MITYRMRRLDGACWIALTLAAAGITHAQPENTGTTQQPLVTVNPPLAPATQQQFGLLTLDNPEGSCSASMLNDYWAITAAHCVFSKNGTCPQFAPGQITLTANWPGIGPPQVAGGPRQDTKAVKARRVITYGTVTACPNTVATPSDIAILQVGLHDFGRPDSRPVKLETRRPMANLTVTGFGRGINTLAAMVGGVAVPSSSDGQYRLADFSIISISPNSSAPPLTYSFPGNRGATIAGGDSGGPSLYQDWDDPLSTRRKLEWRLMGVHSSCNWTCLTGQTCPWQWAASVGPCADAAILPVRGQILADIEAVPADDAFTGTFPPVPPSVVSAKRALYVLSEDEPLVAPAGAAIEKQLTFEMCHAARVIQGCPVKPEFEQWSYDPATHRLYHVASGKCVNIFGGHRTAGTPIILYPCQNAANEKWTVISSGGSPQWSIKSDFSGMCLHADPGRVTSGGGFTTGVATPATLVQRPCNGSKAQQFNNVDADWFRLHGPH